MTPGERLQSIMKEKNIGQVELAELCGVVQSTINRMTKDQQKLNFKVLTVLRQKYKVNINPFFDKE